MTTHISSPTWHACFIKDDGTLWCCGTNYDYALGDLVALDGTVDEFTQVGVATHWVAVSCGNYSTWVLKNDGTVWRMGWNYYGALGTGGTGNLTTLTQLGSATDWAKIRAGNFATFLIKTNGTLWACGTDNGGSAGCTGLNTNTVVTTFTQVGSATNWVDAQNFQRHSIALNSLGELYSTGGNASGQLGQGNTTPRTTFGKIGTATDWSYFGGGTTHTIAMRTTGLVYVWGNNNTTAGTIGQGDAVTYLTSPTLIPGVVAQNVAASASSSAYVSSGTLYTTGTADATGVASTVFTAHPSAPSGVEDVYMGVTNTYAVSNGRVWSVGFGGEGALGNNDIVDITTFYHSPLSLYDCVNSAVESAPATDALSTFDWSTFAASSGAATDSLVSDIDNWLYNTASAASTITSQSNTTSSLADSAQARDVIRQVLQQLVAESATGVDGWFLETSARLVDTLTASGVFTHRLDAINAIAQIVVAFDLAANAKVQEIMDSASGADMLDAFTRATAAVIEQALAADIYSSYLIVNMASGSSATLSESFALHQVLTALVEEQGSAFVRFVINGEVYAGWVMNTQTGAVSEYQGLSFNSMARIGTRYFGATATGVYELTDNNADVHTYIQSGLLDFGSTQQKSATNAYLAVDVDGRIALGVWVSEKTGIAQHWYEVTMDKEAADNVKLPIGRGLKGRYWKFEVASESLSSFDSLTVLPVILTRRV